MIEVEISTEFIKLDQFLKFAGIVETGGQGKALINEGMVLVNGEVCLQRGKKLYPQDQVTIEDFNSYIVI